MGGVSVGLLCAVLVGLLWAAASVNTLPSRVRRQATLEPFTLEETLPSQYTSLGFNGTWISDTEFTYTVPGEAGISVFDVSTLNTSTLVSGELLELLNTNNPIYSPDRQYILAPSEVQPVYRYSMTAKYALYHVETGNVTYIADHEPLELCIFDSVSHSVAYVMNNNAYYLPADATEAIQLTFDGIPGVVYNGHTDWVYEEDVFYTGQALWFSTDGNRLAVASFDDTEVESYSYYYFAGSDPDDVYPELVELKYPKVGHRNPTVNLRVVNLQELVANPNTVNWQTLEAPARVTADHVLGGVRWITATEVAAHWLNRRQNDSILNICNVVTSNCVADIREQPDGWVPAVLPHFSSSGDFYISLRWSLNQADGRTWQHLYQTVRIGNQLSSDSLTPGAFTVDTFVGMDEANVVFYFTRTLTDQPWNRHVYRTGSRVGCLSCNIVLPGGSQCTHASATLSSNGRYMTITCESSFEPAIVLLIDPLTNTRLAVWEDNQAVRDRLANKMIPRRIITTVPLQDGRDAPVRMFLPPELDENDTLTTYPVVYIVYSGPNRQTVQDTFIIGYNAYLTTNRSIIYMMADGRGSGLKDKDMLYAINNNLGSVEIEDHLVILRQLLDRYPWMDRTRVGMWGSSYGGYATLLTHVIDDDNMIRCGVASGPVTSWLYYNTMYTERYMGLPIEEDNLSGYQAGDLTLLAERLRGKDFYIMHGNADDNVHYQNTAKLMRRLQELDIPFEQMTYADEVHSLAGVTRHRYNTMDRYWTKCLDL